MDTREILGFGGHYEVWDWWGNRVFEAATELECQEWMDNNPEEDV